MICVNKFDIIRLYGMTLGRNNSHINSGLRWCKDLYASTIRYWRYLVWIETLPVSWRHSSRVRLKLPWITLKARFWICCIHIFVVLFVNIRQYLKGDRMYALYRRRDFTGLKWFLTLESALILWLAFFTQGPPSHAN